jgi:prepilin-type N-terminal cleavage/methylation domain-containing protein
MMSRPQACGRGFTLLEVILAIALMVLVLSALFAFFNGVMRTQAEAVGVSKEAALTRNLLQRMSDELRQATAVMGSFDISPLVGEVDPPRITFYTRVLPDKELLRRRSVFDERLPPQHDLRRVSYYLLTDDEYLDVNGEPYVFGIVREETKTLLEDVVIKEFNSQLPADSALPAGDQFTQLDLYAPELKFLEFRFYDGAQWVRRWQGGPGQSLPQAVRIVVGQTPEYRKDVEFEKITIDEDEKDDTIDFRKHPDRSAEIVRLPGADPYLGSRLVTASDVLGGEGQ